ncbi:MAG: hypothetical protein ISR96_04900 [Nitrospira sp.]|nr:hypothetical protein [Nitrospira sp.]
MIILTAANSDKAKDDSGNLYRHFSFRGVIQATIDKAKECGYKSVVYDLGTLGIGEKFCIDDKTFSDKGYYEKEVHKGYKSKSLFKPEIMRMCMEENNDFMVYLDGDAQLCDSIDEVISTDYDIGVTLRELTEIESEWHKEHFDIVKYVNAGVIFCNSTPAAKSFLDVWKDTTELLGNDQMALNKLTCPDYYPEPYSILDIQGVRIKYFPCSKYNFYYFKQKLVSDIKIMHFKADVRHFYPFGLGKRLYCLFIIPVLNILRPIVKKVFFR